ncbi:Ribosomal L5P family protein [Hibiscus syriacus]|uniref:Ribosomal L5P family protein n=1 Tax=Hibiscus syriacus TaxID=106335 RepID=A0A6A3BXI8_HIBSY|nr:Ribosomal L5P family protein [Hibiscus syriacus]
MSLECEEQHSLDQRADTSKESQKKSRISYARDFLLSLSDLDVCKKLPPGFDKSIFSEFEDTSQDRQRIPGTFSAYRRNECSSSPPTRGESGNYSRGIHGRWDSRSSGKSDRDSDTQSDLDSDPRRRHGNQSQQSCHGPENDGLLGSGSFPRPSGFTAGASAPKFRANDQYHLNKSNEPYHPPRPYKAVPHSRRETHDSYNDETFGSTECTSEDRAEEERTRRDDNGLANRSKESDEPIPTSNNISEKSFLPVQTLASRPLVPPGFASTILEKNIGGKLQCTPILHVGSFEMEGNLTESKGSLLYNGISDDLLAKQTKLHEEETLNKMLPETSQDGSTSILDIFGSAVIADGGGFTDITEPMIATDVTLSLESSRSKFTHLFLMKKKPIDDLSPGKPKDLLSLIQGGEKGGSHDRMATAVPAVLTCEDLEKSILSESAENDPSLPSATEGWKIPDARCEKKVNVDNHATQHLLSLNYNQFEHKLVQMGSIESARVDVFESNRLPLNVGDDSLLPSADHVGHLSHLRAGLGSKLGFDGSAEIGLPEEDSVLGGSNPVKLLNFMVMKFMAPEGIIHHNAPPNHQFPASGLTGFDPPIHPMLQRCICLENFPPPNLQRGFSCVEPLPLIQIMTGLIPELNPMTVFNRGMVTGLQPNFGLGMPPGHDGSGSHHPEPLQRLIEMELRSKSKQIDPFCASGYSQGQGCMLMS